MPGFDFSEAAIDAYKAIPLHIRQIFAEYTPIIEPLSLDEAYLDVTENLKGINSAIQICDGTGCLDQFPGRTSKGWWPGLHFFAGEEQCACWRGPSLLRTVRASQ